MTSSFALFVFQAGGPGGMSFVLTMGFVMLVFYLLLILPQQRRQKKWQQMLSQLKAGDRVTTSGGLQGIIVSIKNSDGAGADTVVIRVAPDNLRLEFSRAAIVSVQTEDGAKS